MTSAQQCAVKAARAAAAEATQKLGELLEMPPDAQRLIRRTIIAAQLAAVRQVVQWSANERAEVARLTTAECGAALREP